MGFDSLLDSVWKVKGCFSIGIGDSFSDIVESLEIAISTSVLVVIVCSVLGSYGQFKAWKASSLRISSASLMAILFLSMSSDASS